MSQMDYFRRPALAGKTLTRSTVGRIRGSVRRSDADGTSAVPYFPAVVAADTLDIETDAGGPVSVVLTANDLNTILDDINAALGVDGQAFSEDGSIGLATTTAGALGFIKVTGGTASVALGFNTFGGALPIEGLSSDLNSSPEGRVGNPFGVAFPSRENLNTETLTRALGRVASNTDVLWSDHAKDSISFATVAFVVGTAGAYITPTATQRLFVGGGLSAASTRRDLATYYQIIDTVTGLPANSQVTAVVRGTPVGSPPYANSPSWTDVTGKNVLGVGANGQEKVSSATITAITAGRFVECSAATFVTNGVVAGDTAQIVSATNYSPSSNNGMKWVVESVLSETVLTLRPMSKSELDTTGFWTFPAEETQPVVELNDVRNGPEVYGALVIKTGPFAHNVNLVVSPPIPTGAAYSLRAAVPYSLRNDKAQDKQLGAAAALSEIGNDFDPTDNWILDGLTPTLSAPNCVIATGYVRHHGKVFKVPTKTFAPADFTNGTNYVYWSETTGGLVSTTSTADFGSVLNNVYAIASTNRGHPIALVVKTAGVLTSVTRMIRRRAEKALSLTVGASGQFQTLEDAVRYANAISAASGETTSNSGSYPHYEFILTSDLTLTEDITFLMPGVTLRGVDQRVLLNAAGQRLNINGTTATILIKDLIINGSSAAFLQVRNAAYKVSFDNVKHVGGDYLSLILSVGGGTLSECHITGCSFTVGGFVMNIAPGGSSVVNFMDSDFFFSGASATPQIIKETASATWSGEVVQIVRCRFLGEWLTSSGTNAMAFSTSSAASKVIVRDVQFELGLSLSVNNGLLFGFNGHATVENVIVLAGAIPRAVVGSTKTKVLNSRLQVNPEGTSIAVYANEVSGCFIEHQDTDANLVGGVGVQVFSLAWANEVRGPFSYGIKTLDPTVIVSANKVILSDGNSFPLIGIQSLAEDSCVISDNVIQMPFRPTGGVAIPVGISQVGAPIFRLTIRDNFITLQENGYGIQIGTAGLVKSGENVIIAGNHIYGTCTVSEVMTGIDLHGVLFSCSVTDNQIYISGAAGEGNGIYQADGTNTHFIVSGNRVYVDAPDGASGGVYYVATADVTNVVQGNVFQAGTHTQRVSGFRGTTTGNQFLSGAICLVSDTQGVFSDNYLNLVSTSSATLGPGRYDNNTFTIPNVNASTTISDFQFTNNRLSGNFNGTTTTNTFTMFSGNKVAGNTTIDAGSDTKVVITANELLGTFTLVAGTNEHVVILESTYVGGNFAAVINRKLLISNCVFAGTGTQTIDVGEAAEVVGNIFVGRLSMDGFAADQLVSSNKLKGGIIFTADASPAFWKVDGNRIASNYNVTSVEFPAFGTVNQLFLTISNNIIQHGCGEDAAGLASTVPAINFAGNVSGFAIVGNNIAIGRNNTNNNPGGGAGTTNVACVHIVGAGAGNGPNVISSNIMDIPNTLVFTHTYAYYFWYFGQANDTGGAGNILVQNGAAIAAPGDGSQFYTGGATPYHVP